MLPQREKVRLGADLERWVRAGAPDNFFVGAARLVKHSVDLRYGASRKSLSNGAG